MWVDTVVRCNRVTSLPNNGYGSHCGRWVFLNVLLQTRLLWNSSQRVPGSIFSWSCFYFLSKLKPRPRHILRVSESKSESFPLVEMFVPLLGVQAGLKVQSVRWRSSLGEREVIWESDPGRCCGDNKPTLCFMKISGAPVISPPRPPALPVKTENKNKKLLADLSV